MPQRYKNICRCPNICRKSLFLCKNLPISTKSSTFAENVKKTQYETIYYYLRVSLVQRNNDG